MIGLGPITFDYHQLWMELNWGGEPVWFHGKAQPTLHYMVASNLRKMSIQSEAQFFHLTVEQHVTNPTLVIREDALSPFVNLLQ